MKKSRVRTAVLVGLLGVTIAGPCAAQTSTPTEASTAERLQAVYPATRFGAVQATPWPGVFEVVMGRNLAYVDASGQYFLFGHLYDMKAQRDLTAERQTAIARFDFAGLPLNDALKEVRGTGARVLAIFSDPDCPYCRRLEQDLRKLNDVTVYTFLLPIEQLHPAATEKARAVWCSADRQKTWDELMLNNVNPTGTKSCENPVDKIVAFAQQKRINATPTMILADGSRVSGAKSAGELDRLLNEADARCAKEGKALC